MPAIALPTLLRPTSAVLLLAWLSWLGYDSREQLNDLATVANVAPVVAVAPPRATPDPLAIAQLFGVISQEADSPVMAVPLTLLACLQAHQPERSRALIAAPEGSRFYRIGEALPGGAVLGQINANWVLLQRQGTEQRLLLNSSITTLLAPVPRTGERSADATGRLIQPSP